MNEDRFLVKRMLAGEEPAFDEFFEDYFPRLYRFALPRMRHNPDLAEEIVQETLCIAVTKMKTYRAEAALFTWLCTICRREISAYFRKHSRESQFALPEDVPETRASLESLSRVLSEEPESQVLRDEVSRLVQVTLDFLPRWYASALEMKYLKDLPVKEIASRLNLGPKAAESLLTRARHAFREGFTSLTERDMGLGRSER
ncbi:MAG: RNA polymerase sigma factor [Acidobacteriota bacterium]|nr:RNA polymerase sigma factor [Acidobacteriota bacterium]